MDHKPNTDIRFQRVDRLVHRVDESFAKLAATIGVTLSAISVLAPDVLAVCVAFSAVVLAVFGWGYVGWRALLWWYDLKAQWAEDAEYTEALVLTFLKEGPASGGSICQRAAGLGFYPPNPAEVRKMLRRLEIEGKVKVVGGESVGTGRQVYRLAEEEQP